MKPEFYDLGMIGLGVMGCNLVLNMADHGFSIAGLDKDSKKVEALVHDAESRAIEATTSLDEFVASLKSPRTVMMLVPAGKPVDDVIEELLPKLLAGDIIIDGGNSFFEDTERRQKHLAESGIYLLGVGISGGETGARLGPSIMPGGSEKAYAHVRPMFEASAAKVQDEPCVAYLGPKAAGHYVKMVHNGIEYGLMQLIAETYDLLKRGFQFSDDALHQLFAEWNNTPEMSSFLLEITAEIFLQPEANSRERLINRILDEAKQKGTGAWTSESAMVLQIPVPTIDAAVMMRDLSVLKPDREKAAQAYKILDDADVNNRDHDSAFLEQLKKAYQTATILTYAQGLALLKKASDTYAYNLNLEVIARIWRGGCIIRSSLLDNIMAAFQLNPELSWLPLDPDLESTIIQSQQALRDVVITAINKGIPVPGFMASTGYLDAYRSARLPANLIQAQRDYFGAHTYERTDKSGVFHTQWGHVEQGVV